MAWTHSIRGDCHARLILHILQHICRGADLTNLCTLNASKHSTRKGKKRERKKVDEKLRWTAVRAESVVAADRIFASGLGRRTQKFDRRPRSTYIFWSFAFLFLLLTFIRRGAASHYKTAEIYVLRWTKFGKFGLRVLFLDFNFFVFIFRHNMLGYFFRYIFSNFCAFRQTSFSIFFSIFSFSFCCFVLFPQRTTHNERHSKHRTN